MKVVLPSDDEYPILDAKAKAAVTEWRGDPGQLLH
jgi:ATP-dependent Lhr-like helicase